MKHLRFFVDFACYVLQHIQFLAAKTFAQWESVKMHSPCCAIRKYEFFVKLIPYMSKVVLYIIRLIGNIRL